MQGSPCLLSTLLHLSKKDNQIRLEKKQIRFLFTDQTIIFFLDLATVTRGGGRELGILQRDVSDGHMRFNGRAT
ncbi:hypothetical protein LINPERHAP1_LOCUS7358 [Linum perenne]